MTRLRDVAELRTRLRDGGSFEGVELFELDLRDVDLSGARLAGSIWIRCRAEGAMLAMMFLSM